MSVDYNFPLSNKSAPCFRHWPAETKNKQQTGNCTPGKGQVGSTHHYTPGATFAFTTNHHRDHHHDHRVTFWSFRAPVLEAAGSVLVMRFLLRKNWRADGLSTSRHCHLAQWNRNCFEHLRELPTRLDCERSPKCQPETQVWPWNVTARSRTQYFVHNVYDPQ